MFLFKLLRTDSKYKLGGATKISILIQIHHGKFSSDAEVEGPFILERVLPFFQPWWLSQKETWMDLCMDIG
jgi:hypothetical protein